MRSKIWLPILIIVVAVGAFLIGTRYRVVPATDQTAITEPPAPAASPAAEESPPAPPPATTPMPRRAQPAPPPVAPPAPSEPAAAPAEPAATPAAVPAAPADTGVKRVERVDVKVPAGTKIAFTLNDALSTKSSRAGDPFTGVVSREVRVADRVVIPEGSVVHGSVSHVERAGRVKGRSELGLRFDQLELPDGQTLNLSASLTQLDAGQKETVNAEGQVEGQGTKTRDAATIGGGAGIGAVIGAIAGGGKGAATGGAVGAGAGTAMVLLTRGKDVELNRGAELAIQLDRALTVSVTP